MGFQSILIWTGRTFGFGFSILTSAFLALNLAFNVYAIPLKETFNFTQTEVELISSSSLMGMGASLVEPLISSKYGYRAGYLVMWGFTSGSALLMWLSAVYKHYLVTWPSVICLIQFVMSASQCAGSTRITAVALSKKSSANSASIVAIYFSAAASSKLYYGILQEFIFDENFSDFFLFVTVLLTVSVGICYLTHYPEDNTPEKTNCDSLTNNNPGNDQPSTTMIKSPFFHLIFWPSVFLYSIVYALVNNITSIAHSVFVSEPLYASYTLAVTAVVCRFLFGIIFDKSKNRFIGFILVLVGSSAMFLACILAIFDLNTYTIYIVTVCVGISTSTTITIPITMLSLRFGSHQLSHVVGSIYCCTAVMCLMLQYIIGYFYDKELTLDGFCYGGSCFYIPWLIFCGITIVVFVIQVVSCFKTGITEEKFDL